MRRLRQADADMTQGVIWRQLLDFAVPMALGLLFQQLYNTVDTIVVGQFVGKEALAAVGSVGAWSTCSWPVRRAFHRRKRHHLPVLRRARQMPACTTPCTPPSR